MTYESDDNGITAEAVYDAVRCALKSTRKDPAVEFVMLGRDQLNALTEGNNKDLQKDIFLLESILKEEGWTIQILQNTKQRNFLGIVTTYVMHS